jgi:septum formation protein
VRKIILASSSPRRKKLLQQIGLNFTVEESGYEEKIPLYSTPIEIAKFLSLEKANLVAIKHSDAIIIAADTIVVVDGEILGKPVSEENAREMLRKLSDKTHSVITGFTVIDTAKNKTFTDAVETKVTIKDLSELEMAAYTEKEDLTDKAGAYAIQGIAAMFIKSIDGDYFNVVGLPLRPLFLELKNFGINILEK